MEHWLGLCPSFLWVFLLGCCFWWAADMGDSSPFILPTVQNKPAQKWSNPFHWICSSMEVYECHVAPTGKCWRLWCDISGIWQLASCLAAGAQMTWHQLPHAHAQLSDSFWCFWDVVQGIHISDCDVWSIDCQNNWGSDSVIYQTKGRWMILRFSYTLSASGRILKVPPSV